MEHGAWSLEQKSTTFDFSMHHKKSFLSRFFTFTLIAIIGLAAPWAAGAQSGETNEASGQRVYVCNQGEATLSVIDVESLEVVDHIDLQELGFSENAKPHHTVAEPDGSHWYVTLIGENRVLKFNRDNELVGKAKMEVPGLISLHPTRDWLMVGRSMSAVNPPQSIGVIDRSDMQVKKTVETFFARPHAIATTPDGKWTLVGSLAANQILSINNESGETHLYRSEGKTHVYVDFEISPDGNTMVATGQMSAKALVFDISDPSSLKLTDSIEVNAQPWHPVYSADGKQVYFGNKTAHSVTALNMKDRKVEGVVEGEGIAQPHGSALSVDGKYVFISNNNRKGTFKGGQTPEDDDPNGTVTVINTKTHKIEKVIEVEAYPSGIGTRARW